MISLKKILDKLYAVKSPSGYETAMAEVISEIAADAGLECHRDALGNLLVHRRGAGKKCILDAHLDTTGVMATYIDENGYVRFDALGGLSAADIQNAEVEFLNGTRGRIFYEEKCELSKRKISSLYIDIGAKDETSARALVLPGDAAVFSGNVRELSGGRIMAPYLDNRLGCAILLHTLLSLKKCEYDVWGVFAAQEEVGLRGAKVAAYGIDADFAIVLDVTDSLDTPEHKGHGETKMSGGAAIKIMDRAFVAHPAVTSALESAAEKANIAYQRDVITVGGTDGGSINLTRGGVPTGGISVAVRYMHTPCEVADMEDVESAEKLLLYVLENHCIIL
ncbi:MAG: M20/M25/M40 family metallo-hydrolase [Oscillospiraceae bacterium]|nr:M20/M25/M40 family metallo-hydrolase [Oscillospiraceae bacterium]